MAAVFVMVDVEDATPDSLSTELQSEVATTIMEAAVRQALFVPDDKRVTVEPFRNGVILNIANAIALAEMLDDNPDADDELVEQARVAIRAALEVIGRHGG